VVEVRKKPQKAKNIAVNADLLLGDRMVAFLLNDEFMVYCRQAEWSGRGNGLLQAWPQVASRLKARRWIRRQRFNLGVFPGLKRGLCKWRTSTIPDAVFIIRTLLDHFGKLFAPSSICLCPSSL